MDEWTGGHTHTDRNTYRQRETKRQGRECKMMVPYRVYVVRGIRHLINTQRRERCPAVDMPEVKSNERIRVLLWETCCWSAACNSFIGTAWCDSDVRDEWAIVPELVTGHSWRMGLCVSPWRSRRGPMPWSHWHLQFCCVDAQAVLVQHNLSLRCAILFTGSAFKLFVKLDPYFYFVCSSKVAESPNTDA